MKRTIRTLSLILAVSLIFVLSGCGTGEFMVEDVNSIMLSCPDPDNKEGKSVMLSANVHSSDFNEIIELCKGKELHSIDDDPFFGMAKIVFTKNDGSTVTIYPACDGSPYLCLNTLNESLATYLKLKESTMTRLTAILKKHGITLS